MKWSIVILMVLFLACVIWSHGGFDNLSLDNNIVLTYKSMFRKCPKCKRQQYKVYTDSGLLSYWLELN